MKPCETDHLAQLRAFFDIGDELLLTLLKFGPLAIELPLRFGKGPLVLSEAFRWGDRPSEKRFLRRESIEGSDI
jgi:hypothetical protein